MARNSSARCLLYQMKNISDLVDLMYTKNSSLVLYLHCLPLAKIMELAHRDVHFVFVFF